MVDAVVPAGGARELVDALPALVPGLFRYARTLTRDGGQAEDLVQETVVRALERAGSYRGEASPATWVHRILHNLAVDRVRRQREIPVEDVAVVVEDRWRADAYTVDAETVALRAQDREALEDALVHLPVVYRSAVLLHDVEQLTAAEVAAVQEVSLPAAKQRIRRGRMMLVTELDRGAERRAANAGVPLRCWDVRRLISDALDGELDGREMAPVLRHLERCPTCPPLYAALVATRGALAAGATSRPSASPGRDPDSVVPPALAARVRQALARRPAR